MFNGGIYIIIQNVRCDLILRQEENFMEITDQSLPTNDVATTDEGQAEVLDGTVAVESDASPAPEGNASEGAPEGGKKPLKLNYPQTFKVGFAFAIIMLFWTAYDFVVPLLLEHAYGLPNALRGLIMGLDNLLSLFMLPLFGKLSDNAHGKLAKKFGRRTPFIVIGTLASIVLMVFVPVATLKQQQNANNLSAQIEAQLNDDAFMEQTLGEFWDSNDKNLCDKDYLAKNNIKDKSVFVAIRYDANFTSKKAVLNMIGKETYYYTYDWDGDNVAETKEVKLEDTAPNGKTYKQIQEGNTNYNKYVASAMNNYISDQVYQNVTKKSGTTSLAVYMVILLLVLIAMATFRSPAVALMPDVTPKPLRSQGNAVINLCGGVGGAIAFLIYTVVLFGTSLYNYVIIFASVAAGMLLLLAGFLALVKERKLVAKCEEICKEYGIDDFAEGENPEAAKFAEKLLEEGEDNVENTEATADEDPSGHDELIREGNEGIIGNISLDAEAVVGGTAAMPAETIEFARQVVKNEKKPFNFKEWAASKNPKKWWSAKSKEEKSKMVSFWLILASIFMWFLGYNAISSNLSIYTTKELNLSAGVASIISGVSMGISAIAFIPVGYMAAKIGRRKSIIIGFGLAVISFVLIFAFVRTNPNAIIPAVLFSLFYLISGFGLIIANVNTFPMVTELSTAQTVGQYTGYYYMATMSAQAITPFLGGLVMDYISNRGLFVYSAICVAIAIILMIFVKHGDSVIIGKGRKLTKEEKRQIRLDSIDSD